MRLPLHEHISTGAHEHTHSSHSSGPTWCPSTCCLEMASLRAVWVTVLTWTVWGSFVPDSTIPGGATAETHPLAFVDLPFHSSLPFHFNRPFYAVVGIFSGLSFSYCVFRILRAFSVLSAGIGNKLHICLNFLSELVGHLEQSDSFEYWPI